MKCRHCQAELTLPFLDLGNAPPSNAYLSEAALRTPETWFPLRLLVCENCWLVQTEDHAGREALFTEDYAYFSSFSSSWLAHSQAYVAAMRQRFGLNTRSLVAEVAANDGYLLQYVQQADIPCYGIEPTASTATAARAKGIEIVEKFFGVALAEELSAKGRQVDLLAANNVLAHVPDINDFVAGFTRLLKPQGVATFEFPHFLRLLNEGQFDTAYHEHYSYLSLRSVQRILAAQGLHIWDVQELPSHGGSLRVWAQHAEHSRAVLPSVAALVQREDAAGLGQRHFHGALQAQAEQIKNDLLAFLIEQRRAGKRVVAYGAAAKGNTLLNFAGVRADLIDFVVDASPHKQGRFLPGSHIPVVAEQRLREARPDFILILPWNLRDELAAQLAYTRDWGARLVSAVPTLQVD